MIGGQPEDQKGNALCESAETILSGGSYSRDNSMVEVN